jgi:antirestriction protein ArdC
MPPDRPDLPGLAARLENAERFVAATGAVVVNGGDRAYYQSPASTSAPASTIKMVFQAQVSWFGPSNLSTFLCYKRLLLK